MLDARFSHLYFCQAYNAAERFACDSSFACFYRAAWNVDAV